MNLDFSDEDLAFRDDVRVFVASNLSPETARKVRLGQELDKQDFVAWQKALFEKGWIAPTWPVQYGGPGWSVTQQYIFEQERVNGWAPEVIGFGLHLVAHVIYTFGTEQQKKRFLPGILNSDDWWCQGYSEPGAGSDLASLKTRATEKGDHFIVNGQKTWTSGAQHSDWMFCLVRTNPDVKAQAGISFLLIDMTLPGVEIKPISTIDKRHHVNEVFLSDVIVPRDCLIGEVNKGWDYAKFLLGFERMTIARVAHLKNTVATLKDIARAQPDGGHNLLDTESFRLRLAGIELDLMALEYGELRILMNTDAPGVGASMLKIQGTEIEQALAELTVEALGYQALPFDPTAPGGDNNPMPDGSEYAPGALNELLFGRARTIFGGSNEIQRNIISKMMLGM